MNKRYFRPYGNTNSEIMQICVYSGRVRHYCRRLLKKFDEKNLPDLLWNIYKQAFMMYLMIPYIIDQVEDPKIKEALEEFYKSVERANSDNANESQRP